MSFITTATRMWLTKSLKPFTFTNNYSNQLDFAELDNLGLYVHIPFCKSICSFCPYCKQIFDEEVLKQYVPHLIKEIQMVGKQNGLDSEKTGKKKKVTSLYFGGGTPSLAIDYLKDIIDAINTYFEITEGIGLELHPDEVRVDVLSRLKEVGVSKISIGIQSFQDKFLEDLGRSKTDYNKMFEALDTVKFETVSMDFIFALPNQTVEDLKKDIELAFAKGANHIAIYPFIDFTFAKNKISAMPKKEKHALLDEITLYCNSKGYRRDSIWTFSNDKTAKYSSMTRENFLGFGCSATTLLKKQFKVNTFNVKEYNKRIDEENLATSLTIDFKLRQRMVYYIFWTLYTTRLDPEDFKKFFGKSLISVYGLEFRIAQMVGFMKKVDGKYELTMKGCFYYHHYENYYTLSYIDKMWGIMRKEAFPKYIKL